MQDRYSSLSHNCGSEIVDFEPSELMSLLRAGRVAGYVLQRVYNCISSGSAALRQPEIDSSSSIPREAG